MKIKLAGMALLILGVLAGCGGGGAATGGGTPAGGTAGGAVTCNTAHYTAGAVSVPTAADLTSYAKTYTGPTSTLTSTTVTGTTTFVFGSTGSLTYNGASQTVTSICKDNTLPMMYVEFGTGG